MIAPTVPYTNHSHKSTLFFYWNQKIYICDCKLIGSVYWEVLILRKLFSSFFFGQKCMKFKWYCGGGGGVGVAWIGLNWTAKCTNATSNRNWSSYHVYYSLYIFTFTFLHLLLLQFFLQNNRNIHSIIAEFHAKFSWTVFSSIFRISTYPFPLTHFFFNFILTCSSFKMFFLYQIFGALLTRNTYVCIIIITSDSLQNSRRYFFCSQSVR